MAPLHEPLFWLSTVGAIVGLIWAWRMDRHARRVERWRRRVEGL